MASTQEPPTKKLSTDFKLCLYCQTCTNQTLVDTEYRTFKDSAYQNFLDSVDKKREYGNPKIISVGQTLFCVTANELRDRKASWHRDCSKLVLSHVKRDAHRSELAAIKCDSLY